MARSLTWALALVAHLGTAAEVTFTFRDNPVTLRPAEINNKISKPISLPAEIIAQFKNKTAAITNLVVDFEDSQGNRVPLSELYIHHFISYVGNAAGTQWIYDYTKGRDPFLPAEGDANCKERKLPNGFDKQASIERLMGMHGAAELTQVVGLARQQDQDLQEVPPFPADGSLTFVGGATGAEFRHNSFAFPQGFYHAVDDFEHMTAVYHLIRTDVPGTSKLFECPCTPQRRFNFTNVTIDGQCPSLQFKCNDALLEKHNTACLIETYEGGYRCCEDGNFLVDTDVYPVEKAEAKDYTPVWTISMHELSEGPDAGATLGPLTCCDATTPDNGFGNIELDIPQCAPGTPEAECVYNVESVQPIGAPNYINQPDESFNFSKLVRVAGHVHTGALSVSLEVERSIVYPKGTVICEQSVTNKKLTYGTTEGAVGDEKGYLVGIEPCWFSDGEWVLHKDDLVKTKVVYSAQESRHGVMALYLIEAVSSHAPAGPQLQVA